MLPQLPPCGRKMESLTPVFANIFELPSHTKEDIENEGGNAVVMITVIVVMVTVMLIVVIKVVMMKMRRKRMRMRMRRRMI